MFECSMLIVKIPFHKMQSIVHVVRDLCCISDADIIFPSKIKLIL